MRFLLVAPVSDCPSDQMPDRAEDGPDQKVFMSRQSDAERRLRQNWTDFEPAVLADSFESRPIIAAAAVCRVAQARYVVMECVVNRRAVDRLPVAELEEELSRIAWTFIADQDGYTDEQPQWVARYALLYSGQTSIQGWLRPGLLEVDLTDDIARAGSERFVARLGWGNGEVIGWELADEITEQRNFVRGLVDAQHIWNDVSKVDEELEKLAAATSKHFEKPRKRQLRELSLWSSRLDFTYSTHQLLHAETSSRLQSVRRTSGAALLESWGYQDFNDRLRVRLMDIARQIDGMGNRADRRYLAASEGVLFVLAALTLVDIVFNALSVAYSGGISSYPDMHGLGIFHWIRLMDTNLLVLFSVIVTIGLSLLFIRRR